MKESFENIEIIEEGVINMGAYVEQKFKKGFIIDEEKLRKIHEIINKRIINLNKPIKPRYTIYRYDSYSYDTNNLEDIIKEENNEWNGIKKLHITVEYAKEFNFILEFSQENNTRLEIEGNNRDLVYLLLSDLRNYLDNEVNTILNTKRIIIKINKAILSILSIILMGILFKLTLKSNNSLEYDVKEIIKSSDINVKLNYLIEVKNSESNNLFKYFPLTVVLLLSAILSSITDNNAIMRVADYFYPYNVFLIGKQIDKYKQKKEFRSKILWTVIGGFIISVIAGILVFKFTASS